MPSVMNVYTSAFLYDKFKSTRTDFAEGWELASVSDSRQGHGIYREASPSRKILILEEVAKYGEVLDVVVVVVLTTKRSRARISIHAYGSL